MLLKMNVAGDSVLRHQAYGHARLFDFDGQRLPSPPPMTPAHVFDLASLTKVMATTFALMRLVDDGRVLLDAPVRRYLPAFRGPSKDSVTVRHLLTHTSGLPPWEPVYYHAHTPGAARAWSRIMARGGTRHWSPCHVRSGRSNFGRPRCRALPRQGDWLPVWLSLGHDGPGHSGKLVGECYRRFRSAEIQTLFSVDAVAQIQARQPL